MKKKVTLTKKIYEKRESSKVFNYYANRKTLPIKLPKELHTKLSCYAKMHGLTMQSIIEELVTNYMKNK